MWNWLPPFEKDYVGFWAALVAFAGVALTALNAWSVAWFNVRANRRTALDAALRDHRKAWVMPLVGEINHLHAKLAEAVSAAIARDWPAAEAAWRLASQRPTLSGEAPFEWATTDAVFEHCTDVVVECERRLIGELETVITLARDNPPAAAARGRLRDLATLANQGDHAMIALGFATEGFVFDSGKARRAAQQVLKSANLKHVQDRNRQRLTTA